jgi:hypothetical protein
MKNIPKNLTYVLLGLGVFVVAAVAVLVITGRIPGAQDFVLNPPINDGLSLLTEKGATPEVKQNTAQAGTQSNTQETQQSTQAVIPPLKFAAFSDIHVKLDCCAGSFFSRIPEHRLVRIGKDLYNEPINFMISLGDNIADLYGEPKATGPTEVMWKFAQQIYAGTNFNKSIPFYIVLGNHDDRQHTGTSDFSYWREAAKGAWNYLLTQTTINVSPLKYPDGSTSASSNKDYYFWKQNGFNLIVLNSSAKAPSTAVGSDDKDVDPGNKGRYNDGIHFGDDQMTWLETTLNNNHEPTILFWHSSPIARNPDTGLPWVNICMNANDTVGCDVTGEQRYAKIIYDHRTQIRAAFVGHNHYYDMINMWGIPIYQATTSTSGNTWKWEVNFDIGKMKNIGKWNDKGYVFPDYPLYFKVTADASAKGDDGNMGKVSIDNLGSIYNYDDSGIWKDSPAKKAPRYCEIPADSGTPTPTSAEEAFI